MLAGAGAAVLLSLALSLGACSSTKARDLASNPQLYTDVGYRSRLPGDRQVFVTPLRDERDASHLPASNGAFPISYDSEARWERPVPEMVEEILRRELAGSGIFAAVLDRAAPDALVLMPSLVAFHSATMEMMEGGRTLAEAAIRVRVYGPEDDTGGRTLWLDEVFRDAQVSDVGLAPAPGWFLSGRALRNAIHRLLARLDDSNVSRSGVPLESAPRRGG